MSAIIQGFHLDREAAIDVSQFDVPLKFYLWEQCTHNNEIVGQICAQNFFQVVKFFWGGNFPLDFQKTEDFQETRKIFRRPHRFCPRLNQSPEDGLATEKRMVDGVERDYDDIIGIGE